MDISEERHELVGQLRNVTSHNIEILHSFHLESQNLTIEKRFRSKRLCPLKILHGVKSQNTAV
jgi:hypothetical protein